MTRRFLLSRLFRRVSYDYDELTANIIEFEKPWDQFVRALFGCAPLPEVISPETCNPAIGEVDYRAFNRARKAAKRLFNLDEKR